MRNVLIIVALLALSGCTSENRASANIVQKTGYLMQCAARSSCPPMHNESAGARQENNVMRAQKASEPPPRPPATQTRD